MCVLSYYSNLLIQRSGSDLCMNEKKKGKVDVDTSVVVVDVGLPPKRKDELFYELSEKKRLRAMQKLVRGLKNLDEAVIREAWETGLRITDDTEMLQFKRKTGNDMTLNSLMYCLLGEIDYDVSWVNWKGRGRFLPKVCPPEIAVRIMKDAIDVLQPTAERDCGMRNCTGFLRRNWSPSSWRMEKMLYMGSDVEVVGEEAAEEATEEEAAMEAEEEKEVAKTKRAEFSSNAERRQFLEEYKTTAQALSSFFSDLQ